VGAEKDKTLLIKDIVDTMDKGVRTVAFVNAHAMNMATKNKSFANDLSDADWLLRDGSGMQYLAKSMGLNAGLNMNGTDFIPEVLSALSGARVALWGTTEPYLSLAASRLANDFQFEIVSKLDGFQSVEEYKDVFEATRPQLVVLGMGMPKQERVAASIKQMKYEQKTVLICGGAILDFYGGKVKRAPVALRTLGFEWLYRLMLEPKRLFKRYVIGHPVFLYHTHNFIKRYRKSNL
jgi:N-acetylglucosaminyldiphosphoundecaprenol N-acetyl-beta-D-mannosaminyltransferase